MTKDHSVNLGTKVNHNTKAYMREVVKGQRSDGGRSESSGGLGLGDREGGRGEC